MGRPIRLVENNHYYFITNRCIFGKYLMCPDDDEVIRIIKGCLARAAEEFNVDIVCFCFLSNHFHLIAGFPQLNMAEFMEQLQGQIARRINRFRGRTGSFFGQRYDDQVLLDDQVVRDKICYVLNNPVKHGLTRTAGAWPGLSSMEWHRSGEAVEGRWLNGKTWRKLRRRKADHDREEAMDVHRFELHLPEALGGVTDEERRANLVKLVNEDRRRSWAERTGRPDRAPDVLGKTGIRTRHWNDEPEDAPSAPFKRNRRAVANDIELLRNYLDRRRDVASDYREAFSLWRNRQVGDFPGGTYPPGWRHCVGSPARDGA